MSPWPAAAIPFREVSDVPVPDVLPLVLGDALGLGGVVGVVALGPVFGAPGDALGLGGVVGVVALGPVFGAPLVLGDALAPPFSCASLLQASKSAWVGSAA
jgi:hypothetical protein